MRSTRHLQQDLAIYAIFFGVALCAAYLDPHRPVHSTTSSSFVPAGSSTALKPAEPDVTCNNSADSSGSNSQISVQGRVPQIAGTAKGDLPTNPPCGSERQGEER